jgi:hypothetical protein
MTTPSELANVVPVNIQALLAAGATGLKVIRLGANPLVDDSTFRIALPSWSFGNISVSNPLPDGGFRITLPEADYQVGAILPRLGGPRIHIVKALTSGSTNLFSQPLKVLAIHPDGSFEFPNVIQGRYVLHVIPKAMAMDPSKFPRTLSESTINVGDKDVSGIEIVWTPQ